jgi:hypothetical protein
MVEGNLFGVISMSKMYMAAEVGSLYRLIAAAEEYAENSDVGKAHVSSVSVDGKDKIVIMFA